MTRFDLSSEHKEELKSGTTTVDIYEEVNEFVSNAMMKSVKVIKERGMDDIIFPKPKLDKIRSYNRSLSKAKVKYQKYEELNRLNDEQQSVVHAFSSGVHKPHPFILFGPPGTGETHTITATVQYLLKTNSASRILICTPSNMAANRVAEKLLEAVDGRYLTLNNILRLHSEGNVFAKRDKRFDEIICM